MTEGDALVFKFRHGLIFTLFCSDQSSASDNEVQPQASHHREDGHRSREQAAHASRGRSGSPHARSRADSRDRRSEQHHRSSGNSSSYRERRDDNDNEHNDRSSRREGHQQQSSNSNTKGSSDPRGFNYREQSSSPLRNKRRYSSASDEDSDDSGRRRRDVQPRYGLIPSSKASNRLSAPSDATHLGPSLALLQKKSDKERIEQEQRMSRSKENVKALSEEERLRRIAAMQQDAQDNDTSRIERHRAYDRSDHANTTEHTGNAVFIDSMRRDVYSLEGTAGGGIKERLDQNKHYRQSSGDMERDGFRKNK